MPGATSRRVQTGPYRWGRSATAGTERRRREPGEDPLRHVVERLVGHGLLELAVDDIDVDAELIRAVRAGVGRQVAYRVDVLCDDRTPDVELFAK
jgi:hypothetical protein